MLAHKWINLSRNLPSRAKYLCSLGFKSSTLVNCALHENKLNKVKEQIISLMESIDEMTYIYVSAVEAEGKFKEDKIKKLKETFEKKKGNVLADFKQLLSTNLEKVAVMKFLILANDWIALFYDTLSGTKYSWSRLHKPPEEEKVKIIQKAIYSRIDYLNDVSQEIVNYMVEYGFAKDKPFISVACEKVNAVYHQHIKDYLDEDKKIIENYKCLDFVLRGDTSKVVSYDPQAIGVLKNIEVSNSNFISRLRKEELFLKLHNIEFPSVDVELYFSKTEIKKGFMGLDFKMYEKPFWLIFADEAMFRSGLEPKRVDEKDIIKPIVPKKEEPKKGEGVIEKQK